MFWRIRHKANVWEAGLNLFFAFVLSIFCLAFFGWIIALGVFAVWMLFLDGIASVYYLIRVKPMKRSHDESDKKFVTDTMKNTENNPTIR